MEYHLRAMKIREEKLGIDHIDTSESYNNIGRVYLSEKKYEKSLEYYLKAMKIREDKLGKNHIVTAESYHNIAIVY